MNKKQIKQPRQPTPQVGQVWELSINDIVGQDVIEHIVKVYNAFEDYQNLHFKSGAVFTGEIINTYGIFIPQNDLERIALQPWVDVQVISPYTKAQWQECRYDLGLDERPLKRKTCMPHTFGIPFAFDGDPVCTFPPETQDSRGCGSAVRQPIGILPRKIHTQNRALELLSAMERYVEVDKPIPRDWLLELSGLCGGS